MRRKSAERIQPRWLGVEGGGSRTVAVLTDSQGAILERAEAGPANSRLISDRQLAALLAGLAKRFPAPAAVGIGLAGIHDQSDRQRVRRVLGQIWPGLPCWVGNDLESGFAAAGPPPPPGHARVLVISGTGSCCYGRNGAGRIVKVGGWGHVLGDNASGFDIARRALNAVMKEHDHTGVWPPLGRQFFRALLLNSILDLVDWSLRANKPELASLAQVVFRAAAEGDPLAREVLREAFAELAADAATCARRLETRSNRVEVFCTGSVLISHASYLALFRRCLRQRLPGCQVQKLPREGAWGAAMMAASVLPDMAVSDLPGHRRRPATRAAGVPSWPLPEATGPSPTEARNPRSLKLDRMPLAKAIDLMLAEESQGLQALRRERANLEKGVRLIARALRQGGRLFYAGAGTSGRLGVLDASECPPTFGVGPDQVQGIIAGGLPALHSSIEGAEDDANAGAQAVAGRGVGRKDVVVGIAASGRTPFVWGALGAAKKAGAATILFCCNPCLRFPRGLRPTLVIAPRTGPEILTGSTRLKAGTATKLALNIFSTLAMVKLGKVSSNLMVDVRASNAKLRERAVRILRDLSGADDASARAALERSGWHIKKALRRQRKTRRGN